MLSLEPSWSRAGVIDRDASGELRGNVCTPPKGTVFASFLVAGVGRPALALASAAEDISLWFLLLLSENISFVCVGGCYEIVVIKKQLSARQVCITRAQKRA